MANRVDRARAGCVAADLGVRATTQRCHTPGVLGVLGAFGGRRGRAESDALGRRSHRLGGPVRVAVTGGAVERGAHDGRHTDDRR